MRSSKTYVEYELKRLEKRKKNYKARLCRLPAGKLRMFTAKGKLYYSHVHEGKSTYIGHGEHEVVKKLKERKFLEVSIRNMDCNQKLMTNFLQEYRPTGAEEVMQSLPKTYRMANVPCLDELVDGKIWSESTYNKSAFHPENLIHKTRKGDLVRSKSEAIIADMLYDLEIYYHYEEKLKLGDRTIVPDFKIAVRSENRFKYLEHCGMMGDERYAQNFTWKLRQYLAHGYLPWRDIFFTFDDMNGNIDTVAIHEMLEHYFV